MEEEDEYSSEEEMEECHGFIEYKTSAAGDDHPSPICESSALAWAEAPPLTFSLSVASSGGGISAVQVEAVQRIMQRHEERLCDGSRGGFLLGDGTGVGKGRTIAATIKENHHRGQLKALWISSSWDLMLDAERDLEGVGCRMELFSLIELTQKSSEASVKSDSGVLFCTYFSLAGSSSAKKFKEVLDYLGSDFGGVIALDECHKAKNYKEEGSSSRTGNLIVQLQRELPDARLIYVSATGASDLDHFQYMPRLGLWGGSSVFKTGETFISAVKQRGVGAIELLSLELKMSGKYIARHLSFAGIKFHREIVELSEHFSELYETSTELWMLLLDEMRDHPDQRKVCITFWNLQQQFFSSLIVLSKVETAAQIANKAVEEGKSVIIGLQKTGESSYKTCRREKTQKEIITTLAYIVRRCIESLDISDQVAESSEVVDDSESSSRASSDSGSSTSSGSDLESGSDSEASSSSSKSFSGSSSSSSSTSSSSSSARASPIEAKRPRVENGNFLKIFQLTEKLNSFGKLNALDKLHQLCGGAGNVAEITGRAYRPCKLTDGSTTLKRVRSTSQFKNSVNNVERSLFQKGLKKIAIISEAGSTGVSLHCEAGGELRQRLQIVLELPWSAERTMQQLGRSNRASQALKPEILVLLSPVPGEIRFISSISQRLQTMGAIVNANKNANNIGLTCVFGSDVKISKRALGRFIAAVGDEECERFSVEECRSLRRELAHLGMTQLNKTGDTRIKSHTNQLQKFMNRMLMLPLDDQRKLLEELNDIYSSIYEELRKKNKLDRGILEYKNVPGSIIKLRKTMSFTKDLVKLQLHEILYDRGCPWGRVLQLADKFKKVQPIFGISDGGKVMLGLPLRKESEEEERSYDVLLPSCGRLPKQHTKSGILGLGYRESAPGERSMVEERWNAEFNGSLGQSCLHKFRTGACHRANCKYGRRVKIFSLLCGTLHEVWDGIEEIQNESPTPAKFTMQNKECLFGFLIDEYKVARVVEFLKNKFGSHATE